MLRDARDNIGTLILIVAVVGIFMFILTDKWTGSSRMDCGTITEKIYHAPYTTYNTSTDSSGHTTTTPVHHDAEYIFMLNVESRGIHSLHVYSWTYYKYAQGERVIVNGTIGGLTNWYYADSVSKMKSAEY